MKRLIVSFIFCAAALNAAAQAERSEIREGNELYKKQNFQGAEVKYRSALQLKGDSYGAMSNLGSALFKQKQSAQAQEIFKKIVEQSADLDPATAQVANYNLGNAYLQERKLDEAIESYKSALRLKPGDEMAQYNLAYAQKLKQDNKGGGGGGQDQNKDQQQDQKQDPKQDPNKQDKDKQQPQEQPKTESRQDADRLLNALQDAENRTKEKVDNNKDKKAVGKGSGKQW